MRQSTSERKRRRSTRAKQSVSPSRLRFWPDHVITGHNTHTTVKLFALWSVAIVIFASGLASIIRQYHPIVLRQNSSKQQNNIPVHATAHTIFRVNGIAITDTQWHNAVQAAFEARASSGQYLGGTQIDNTIINTQAMHIVLDPIAQQEVVKEHGLTTNSDALYQEWFAQTSPQERQVAQQYKDAASYKLQMAQEQLERDIVTKVTTLPSLRKDDIFTYYLQHLS